MSHLGFGYSAGSLAAITTNYSVDYELAIDWQYTNSDGK